MQANLTGRSHKQTRVLFQLTLLMCQVTLVDEKPTSLGNKLVSSVNQGANEQNKPAHWALVALYSVV